MNKWFTLIPMLLLISACTNNQDMPVLNDVTTTIQEETSIAENAGKEKLFELKSYNWEEKIMIGWGGQEFTAVYSEHPYVPLGLYVPEQMETYEFEDGRGWGYSKEGESEAKSFISTLDYGYINLNELTLENEELIKYDEYIGSEDLDARVEDFFLVEHAGQKYVVRFSYFKDEKEKAIPMFLAAAKTLRIAGVPQ
ncbi:hypothetical protein ACFOLF_03350 [Paenibacillus sepulcri]|uniref:Lipoprotein n=1 Tax=Paenibacillus sepulcri TaxID=359917 RepID=A0ABS7C5N3_9BACL|nr:hypothetical protein [Paenibacillus sepulcri]